MRQFRYFLAVVDQGGVHRAADSLAVAQPSVSQALRSLEQDLGTSLFNRTGRTLTLTAAGEAIIPALREVMHGVDLARSLVDAVEGLQGGRLVISSTPSQAASPLAPLVGRFLKKHPGVQIVVKSAASRGDVIASLREGGSELGLMARSTSDAPPMDLAIQPLEVQNYLCVAKDPQELPSGGELLPPEALFGARLIVGQPGTGVRRAADLVLAGAPGSRIAVEIESREALLPLVLAGAGIAVVADGFRAAAEASGLTVRALDLPESLAVDLTHRPGPVSPAAREFLSLARDWSSKPTPRNQG
ncbi:LysR family transcriptional regulator [Nesterenkonia halotolerans]|uniref:LysR family transcriptional regulator n=1 Tax=Nesterenkonia halotolerans TaxID=225325 RepID=UPI001CEF509E